MDLEEELSPDEKATLATVDRALHASLDVEPSPEFLARVRRRIDKERALPSYARVWWGLVAATCAAVIATIAPTLLRPPHITARRTPVAEPRPAVPEAAAALAMPASKVPGEVKRPPRRRERGVRVDPRARQALAEYAAFMRTQKGAIAGSLDARVAAMDELPRYQGVPLTSTAATEDLPRVSVLEELPRFERSKL
jgi:hypothetical protein